MVDISDIQDEAGYYQDASNGGVTACTLADYRRDCSGCSLSDWIFTHARGTASVIRRIQSFQVNQGSYFLPTTWSHNLFDANRSAWTYRGAHGELDHSPYPLGYAPLGVDGGIRKAISRMAELSELLKSRDIQLTVAVYPWPAQLVNDHAASQQVEVWRSFCAEHSCRFIDIFPAFFDLKNSCSKSKPGCWYEKAFIFGDIHFNSFGNEIVAQELLKGLPSEPCVSNK